MSLTRAIAERDVALLPSRRDEDWRWTDLRGLLRSLPDASPAHDGARDLSPYPDSDAFTWTIVNSRGPSTSDVPAEGKARILLRVVSTPDAGAQAASLRLTIGAGAEVVLLESHEGHSAGMVSDTQLMIVLGAGARLERVIQADDHDQAVSVVTTAINLGEGATFQQTVLTTGARRQRFETRVTHAGHGARVQLDGVYLLRDKRHADLTTVVDHQGPGGVTEQLTRGVAGGQARGVFQGRIVVAVGADQTDARMGHHGLILSDQAEIDAKPELQIWADDVSCSHGNTIGSLDEEALFYAAQRGIPPEAARALLTAAFVAEVIDRVGDEMGRAAAQAWLERNGHGL